jgi:small subunit ribosomal protein S9
MTIEDERREPDEQPAGGEPEADQPEGRTPDGEAAETGAAGADETADPAGTPSEDPVVSTPGAEVTSDDSATSGPAEEGVDDPAAPNRGEEATTEDSVVSIPGADPREQAAAAESPGEAPAAPDEPVPDQAEAPADEARTDQPSADDEPAAPADEPSADEPSADQVPAAADAAAPGPATDPPARTERPTDPAGEGRQEVVPGADLEPDLVLDQPSRPADDDEYGVAAYAARYAEPDASEAPAADGAPEAAPSESPRTPVELAADARYRATGKRKTSVARVILRPGSGTYTINGRPLEQFFPRAGLQQTVRQPLEAAGYEARMDVVARLHGGGVSSQAGALRHGVARALVEADPNLRGELKRRGYLTRDPRSKERKKAGLKKARKRPQFSKR